MNKEPGLIFFYGTLMSKGEQTRDGLLKIADDSINGEMWNVGAFPAVFLGGDETVKGEVWRIENPAILRRLDMYEGCHGNSPGDLYHRKEVVTHRGHRCWVYEFNQGRSNLTKVESGDWHDR